MADISAIKLPNGTTYNLKDTTARNAANSAVPNTRTVNGKALSSNISLGAGDVGAYTKSETDTKINAAVASTYKYKGSVTADKLPTSGQVVGDVYNITNDSSYGKAGMNVAWNGTTWDALGSNVDLSNYVTTSDSRLSNARPASDVYAWAKAASKPSYSASEIGAAPASHNHDDRYYTESEIENKHYTTAIEVPSGTVDDLFLRRRNTTGGVGSIGLTKKSSGVGSEIPAGWYNYFYAPHRNGIEGDDPNYATIILTPMTFSGNSYILRAHYDSGGIVECKPIITAHQSLSNYVTTSDSRLTNARPASDVYAWAKAAKKPSYSASEISGLGSLATKNSLSAGDVGAVSKSGDTMTGNLTAPSFQTGTGDANYFQCKKFRGEGNADTYYHAVDFGYADHNQVDFYEYGGKYVFHRHLEAAKSSGDTVIGEINGNGFVGKVNGHTINADVPAGAKFTDTTYGAATQSSPGLMSAADKKKLDSYTTGSAGGAVEVTLAVASWSSSTTEINGNKYYTYSVSVPNIGNPHPQIFCSGGNSIIPSAI